MNLPYSVPERTNYSVLWLLAAVLFLASLFLASLFLALQAVGQSVLVELTSPVAVPDNQEIPQVVPVPEPAQSQMVSQPRASATPLPTGAQLSPVPQPVPTPPVGP